MYLGFYLQEALVALRPHLAYFIVLTLFSRWDTEMGHFGATARSAEILLEDQCEQAGARPVLVMTNRIKVGLSPVPPLLPHLTF